MRISIWLERLLVALGCGLIVAVGIKLVEAASFQESAARAFDRELVVTPDDAPFDHGLIGRLEIPRLRMSVMVMEGDDDPTLALAAGHVPGTALPWQGGNTAIAGHRDTFFRPLKNLREGDAIRMTTTRGTFEYRVIRTEIVEPTDVSVLAPTPGRSLTLVTCYPFVYVGRAPQRFIIQAQALK